MARGVSGEFVNYPLDDGRALVVFEPADSEVAPVLLRKGPLDGISVSLPHYNDPARDVAVIEVRITDGRESFSFPRYRHSPPAHAVVRDMSDPALWYYDGDATPSDFLGQRANPDEDSGA